MNKILLFFSLCLGVISVKGQYTLERHQINSSGGTQSNSLYSVTTANHGYQAQQYQNSNYSGNSGFLYPELHTLPPHITSITDVPNDQGKQVQIVWNKSDYDDSYSPDKFYSIWREDSDPGKASGLSDPLEVITNNGNNPDKWFWARDGEVWTYIDTVPALGYNQYSANAPTLFDSVAFGINYSTFMVVFHDEFQYYESLADSGYSVDNLAPNAPVVEATLLASAIQINWDNSLAEDFQYFSLYRSEDSLSFPATPLTNLTDTVYIDYDLSVPKWYYYVTATDFNGNESSQSNIVEVLLDISVKLDLKIYLEGPYNGSVMNTLLNNSAQLPLSQPYNSSPWNYSGTETVTSIPADVVDWVLVELRDAVDAASAGSTSMIEQQAAFLLNNGAVVGLDGNHIASTVTEPEIINNLFVAVYHRNHLAVISNYPLSKVAGVYTFDFTNDVNQAYGGINAHNDLGSGVYGLFSGDANADGVINFTDKSLWQLDAGTWGYLPEDFSMDGQVNNPDKNDIWVENINQQSQVPE